MAMSSVRPMAFRNSGIPSIVSTWVAHKGRLLDTLLGLITTRRPRMPRRRASANGFMPSNAIAARSVPVVRATRLTGSAAEAGGRPAQLREVRTPKATPAKREVFRKARRLEGSGAFMVRGRRGWASRADKDPAPDTGASRIGNVVGESRA